MRAVRIHYIICIYKIVKVYILLLKQNKNAEYKIPNSWHFSPHLACPLCLNMGEIPAELCMKAYLSFKAYLICLISLYRRQNKGILLTDFTMLCSRPSESLLLLLQNCNHLRFQVTVDYLRLG